MADLLSVPLSPVINRPYKVRREYRTEILTSRSGREQRRALRATPRKTVEFQTTLSPANAHTFHREMVTAQGREIILPARPPIHGDLEGHLTPELQAPQRWKHAVDPNIVFQVTPGSEAAESDGTAMATFSGREVWLSEPNIFDPINITHVVDRETIDAGHGIWAPFFPGDFIARLWQAQYTTLDSDAAEEVRAFFTRQLGQCGEFFMPTFDNDLPPLSQAGSGTSTLTTAGIDVFTFFDEHPAYVCICAKLPDGSYRLNRVTNITTSGGNSILALANPWAVDIPTSAVVSWMPLWRFATDALEVEWVMDRSARTQLSLRMLHFDTAETP